MGTKTLSTLYQEKFHLKKFVYVLEYVDLCQILGFIGVGWKLVDCYHKGDGSLESLMFVH